MRFSYGVGPSLILTWLARVTAILIMTLTSVHAHEHGVTTGETHVEIISQRSFDDTVDHLKWRFGDHGMVVSWASDYAGIVDHNQNQLKSAVVFELMRPTWLSAIIDIEPRAVLSMPVRVMVVETANGETLVSYLPSTTLLRAWDDSRLEAIGNKVDSKLARAVKLATRI